MVIVWHTNADGMSYYMDNDSVYRAIKNSFTKVISFDKFHEFENAFNNLSSETPDLISGNNYNIQVYESFLATNRNDIRKILWYYVHNYHKVPNSVITIHPSYFCNIIGKFWDLVTWGLCEQHTNNKRLKMEPDRRESDRRESIRRKSPWSNFLTKGLYDPRLLLWIFAFGKSQSRIF